jgi:hypothetical protein
MKTVRALGLVALSAAFSAAAFAVPITLDSNPSTFYQNTEASPCVIGGENCKGNLPYTVAGSGGSGTEFDEYSPVYAFTDITGLTGTNGFTIGIDYNDTSKDQILREFSMIFCTDAACNASAGTTQTYLGPTDLKTIHNGVGFSDFLLNGFDLGAANGGDTYVKFHAVWFNNDGPDRYFIVGCQDEENCGTDEPAPVPEPSSMLLMGGGLLGLAWWRKRKNS